MKAKVFLAISMIALSVTGVSAPTKVIVGGLSVPNGYFAEDEYDKNGCACYRGRASGLLYRKEPHEI